MGDEGLEHAVNAEELTNVDPLTSERCLEVVGVVRSSLDAIGLALPGHAPLSLLMREIEWVASHGETEDGAIAAAHRSDPKRAARAFLPYLQLQNIGAALRAAAPAVPAGHPIRRALRKQFDRTVSVEAPAENHLFELEIAGRLGRRGPGLRFNEPDLTYPFPRLGRLGLACKRCQNIDRLRERIAEGAEQIERTGRPGVVVVDLQPILYRTGDPVRKTYSYQVERQHELVDGLTGMIDGVVAVVAESVRAARRRKGVHGVVFTAMAWGFLDGGGRHAYLYAWLVRTLPAPTKGESVVATALAGARASWEHAA